MKKLLCLFLLLWLPLFSAAAAAMSMQMQLSAAPAQAEHMPCHDVSTTQAIPADHDAAQPCCGDHDTSHNCFACGVCAFSHASSHPTDMAALTLPAPDTSSPGYLARVFSSQLYPPALKPPISA